MSRFLVVFLISTTVILLLDLYVFKGIKLLIQPLESRWLKTSIKWAYWSGTIIYVIYYLWMITQSTQLAQTHNFRHFYALFGLFILMLIPKLIFALFHLADDLSYGVMWLWNRLCYSDSPQGEGIVITRGVFLSRVGMVLAAVPFFSILYGMLKGKYDFRVLRESITFPNLPEAFNGFTIVQISDAHLGSFLENKEPVKKAIAMINELNPDLVVFTGDLVNNYAEEAEPWIEEFRAIHAKYGKFSILGNHDYGDYVEFASPALKEANLNRLKAIHGEMGFRLLLNENQTLSINGQEISLIGIENWGKGFKQMGDLKKATLGTEDKPFKLLLSHDPSHWDAQVIGDAQYDLALAGHTHGMQFGIEIAGIKWSPVKYRYPRWGGLYNVGKQYIYVNRGFGFLGFPGRVGMPPEITMIELRRG
ncbi:MAG: metallophosphoesterase [Bacteroidota bacterium]